MTQSLAAPLLALALASGMIVPLQAGMNATLSRHLGSPLWATGISFVVAMAAILAAAAMLRPALPAPSALSQAPWWAWLGGALGALYVTAALMLAPKLGATAFLAAIVAGQMIAALLLDRFGLAGFASQAITAPRLVGAALVVAGVLVIQIPAAEPRAPLAGPWEAQAR